MATERAIVYGLGRMFARHYIKIHEEYNVVGYCDADRRNRDRFVNGLAPEELGSKRLSYDVLLITPRQGGIIARELVSKYGVDSSKIRMLCMPMPMPASKKVNSNLPDLVIHGIYQEDIAILYLCRKLDLDYKNICYVEAGLFNIIKGSATYCLYREGARGMLLLQEYDDWEKQAKVYRAEDNIMPIKTVTISDLLDCKERLDVLALHTGCSTKEWREVVYAKKPMILALMVKDITTIGKIIASGYTWFTALQGECSVFYRLRKDL